LFPFLNYSADRTWREDAVVSIATSAGEGCRPGTKDWWNSSVTAYNTASSSATHQSFLLQLKPCQNVAAAGFLKAKIWIPMHYNTFDLIMADPAEFVRKAEAKGHHAVVVAPGGTYKVA
jgi:hypothetical protein